MKNGITYVVLFDMLFLVFLFLSGTVGGVVGEVLYYLAFAVPLLTALAFKKFARLELSPPKVRITAENFAMTLPFVPLSIAAVLLVSFLTSLLMSLFGLSPNSADVSGNIFAVIIKHALITAVLEEALFRYLPLAFLSGIKKRCAVVLSALLFAFAHCNLYQIPYAFLAGLIFAALDIALDSMLPSVLIHFFNNLVSVFWLREGGSAAFAVPYFATLAVLCVAASVFVFVFRKRYREKLAPVFSGEGERASSAEPLIFATVTLAAAILSL